MGAGTRCGPKGPSIVERVRGRHPTVASRGSSRESTLLRGTGGKGGRKAKARPPVPVPHAGAPRTPARARPRRGGSARTWRRGPGRAPSSTRRLPPARQGKKAYQPCTRGRLRAPALRGVPRTAPDAVIRGAVHRSGHRPQDGSHLLRQGKEAYQPCTCGRPRAPALRGVPRTAPDAVIRGALHRSGHRPPDGSHLLGRGGEVSLCRRAPTRAQAPGRPQG